MQGSIDAKEKRATEDRKSSAEGIGGRGEGGGGESEKLSLDENGEHSIEAASKQKLVEAVTVDHISSSSDEENAVANPLATESAHNFLFQVMTR